MIGGIEHFIKLENFWKIIAGNPRLKKVPGIFSDNFQKMKKAGHAHTRTRKSRQKFGKNRDFVPIGLKLFDFAENIFSGDYIR